MYKGQRIDGSWTEGELVHDNEGNCYIGVLDKFSMCFIGSWVQEDTVGVVFENLLDKKLEPIWEKSILQSDTGDIFIVTRDDTDTGFVLENTLTGTIHYFSDFMNPSDYFKDPKVLNLKQIGNTIENSII